MFWLTDSNTDANILQCIGATVSKLGSASMETRKMMKTANKAVAQKTVNENECFNVSMGETNDKENSAKIAQ